MNEKELKTVLDKVWKELQGLTVGEINSINNAVANQVASLKVGEPIKVEVKKDVKEVKK